LKLAVRPSSVSTVTDGTFASIALIVTVAVICCATVALGFAPVPRVTFGSPVAGACPGWPGLRIWQATDS